MALRYLFASTPLCATRSSARQQMRAGYGTAPCKHMRQQRREYAWSAARRYIAVFNSGVHCAHATPTSHNTLQQHGNITCSFRCRSSYGCGLCIRHPVWARRQPVAQNWLGDAPVNCWQPSSSTFLAGRVPHADTTTQDHMPQHGVAKGRRRAWCATALAQTDAPPQDPARIRLCNRVPLVQHVQVSESASASASGARTRLSRKSRYSRFLAASSSCDDSSMVNPCNSKGAQRGTRINQTQLFRICSRGTH